MVHRMVGGMVKGVSAYCWLLPLVMLELPVLLVSISLSPTPVTTVSGVTVTGNNQDGFLPHQKTGSEGKVEENDGFHHQALNASGTEMLSPVLRSQKDECQMLGNSNIKKK